MKRERKIYNKEFKIRAVELSNARNSVVQVAEELTVSRETLKRWKKEYNAGKFTGEGFKGKLRTPEQEEILRLKKALNEAEIERDILKKAVAIFSVKKDR